VLGTPCWTGMIGMHGASSERSRGRRGAGPGRRVRTGLSGGRARPRHRLPGCRSTCAADGGPAALSTARGTLYDEEQGRGRVTVRCRRCRGAPSAGRQWTRADATSSATPGTGWSATTQWLTSRSGSIPGGGGSQAGGVSRGRRPPSSSTFPSSAARPPRRGGTWCRHSVGRSDVPVHRPGRHQEEGNGLRILPGPAVDSSGAGELLAVAVQPARRSRPAKWRVSPLGTRPAVEVGSVAVAAGVQPPGRRTASGSPCPEEKGAHGRGSPGRGDYGQGTQACAATSR